MIIRIINIFIYLAGLLGCYWYWGVADEETKGYLFFILFVILIVQGNYQSIVIHKLEKELADLKKEAVPQACKKSDV